MAIKQIHDEIERFLASEDPEVLCIKGGWGVGKTYTWNQYLKEASVQKIALKKYSYVSLFGLRSLGDLRSSIFENTIGINQISNDIKENSFEGILKWIKANHRKSVRYIDGLTKQYPYIPSIERMFFAAVRDQIICIDDLERAGEELNLLEVLGLIAYLKDQKKCKIVLLLNDEEFKDESRKIFDKQLEKVLDVVLEFKPTPLEAVNIVFPEPEGIEELLHEYCSKLGITNIRIIKKIERNCRRLNDLLSEKYPKLISQAVHSATLFTWSVLNKDEAPPVDFLKDTMRIHGGYFSKEKKAPGKEEKWQALLMAYGFTMTDEFDLAILEGVKLGYFDPEVFNEAAEKQKAQIEKQERSESFSKVWEMYHGSFDDNEKEFLDALLVSARKDVDQISPPILDSTITFLKEFDRKAEALELINYYVKARAEEKSLFDLRNYPFRGDIHDQDVLDAFKEKLLSFTDSRDPKLILMDISKNHGWNPEDVEVLARLSVEDFYKMFKEAHGNELNAIINAAIQFRSVGGDKEEAIAEQADKALQKIGKESRLNARRVSMRGIKVD